MPPRTLTQIRDATWLMLRDNSLADFDLTDNELDVAIDTALIELSESMSVMLCESMHTTAGTAQVDLSEVDGLPEVTEVEYPVNLSPAPSIQYFLVRPNPLRFGNAWYYHEPLEC